MQNPAQIQNVLRSVPDAYLQKEMQNPTGAVPQFLVLAELQRRQRIRATATAQQADPNPQSVAEDVMGEDTGVATLPANNMLNMKEGGIVGYAGGGLAQDHDKRIQEEELARKLAQMYATSNSPLTEQLQGTSGPMGGGAGGGGIQEFTQAQKDRRAVGQLAEDVLNSAPVAASKDVLTAGPRVLGTGLNYLGRGANTLLGGDYVPSVPEGLRVDGKYGMFPWMQEYMNNNPGKPKLPGSVSADKTLLDVGDVSDQPVNNAKKSTDKSTSGGKALNGGIGAVMPKVGGYEWLRSMIKKTPGESMTDEEGIKQYKKQLAAEGVTGDVGSTIVDYLKDAREDVNHRKTNARGEALINAGLAMMTANSPYFLQNVGTGLQQGVSSYKDTRKGLREDERGIMGLEADVEAKRRAEKMGIVSQGRQAANESRKAAAAAQAKSMEAGTRMYDADTRLAATTTSADATLHAAMIKAQDSGLDPIKFGTLVQKAFENRAKQIYVAGSMTEEESNDAMKLAIGDVLASAQLAKGKTISLTDANARFGLK